MFVYYIGRSLQLAGMWVLLIAVFTAGEMGPSPRLFAYGVGLFVVGWGIVRYRGRANP